MNNDNNLTRIFKDGILIQVHVSFWSGAKILRPEDLGLKPENIAETYKLGRKYLVPEKVIREFRRIEGQARFLVDKNSYPFPFGNARFITRRSYKKVVQKLQELKSEYMSKADELVEKYDQYRQEILPVYREAAEKAWLTSQPSLIEGNLEEFDKNKENFIREFLDRINSYYPPVHILRNKFSLTWEEYEIAAPRMIRADTNTLLADIEEQEALIREARTKIRTRVDDFVTEVVKVLRSETLEMCNHVITSIKEGKVIRSTTINSLKEFITRFREMNFIGDLAVSEQLDNLERELLNVYSPTEFSSETLREELSRKLQLVVAEASKLTEQDINQITGQYNRKVNWED